MSNHKRFIAVVERSPGVIIPLIKGSDGPDADCMAVFSCLKEAREKTSEMLLAQAFGVEIIDMDDAS
jgi:hypothetical protein